MSNDSVIGKDNTRVGPSSYEALERDYLQACTNLAAVQERCTQLKNENRQIKEIASGGPSHFTFRDLQFEAAAWTLHNFPNQKPFESALGMLEEIGEFAAAAYVALVEAPPEALEIFDLFRVVGNMAHARLKMIQGIRGSTADHLARITNARLELGVFAQGGKTFARIEQPAEGVRLATALSKDAVADLIIFAANFCTKMGWDFQQIVESTWRKVAQRDWKKNKVDGGDGLVMDPAEANGRKIEEAAFNARLATKDGVG